MSSGFGSAVAEVMAEEGLSARLVRIGVPDEYSLLGPPTHLYRHYGLDADGVAASVRKALDDDHARFVAAPRGSAVSRLGRRSA